MKKGIGAIEAQIDSVTAYRENQGPRRRYRDRDWERAERDVDREELAQLAADRKALQDTRSLLANPHTMLSIQGEQFDEPFGYCG